MPSFTPYKRVLCLTGPQGSISHISPLYHSYLELHVFPLEDSTGIENMDCLLFCLVLKTSTMPRTQPEHNKYQFYWHHLMIFGQ